MWREAMGVLACLGVLCGSVLAETVKVSDMAAFDAAVAAAVPGDTILLANGTWRDAVLRFVGQGEEGRPVVVGAETPGHVAMTGASRISIAGSHLEVSGLWFKDGGLDGGHVVAFRGEDGTEARSCRLTDTAITEYNPASDDIGYKWVSLYGVGNRVDHCYFRGQNNEGQSLVVWVGDAPNEHVIDHNLFAGRPPLGRNGGETLRVGTSHVSMQNSRTLVERNWFEACDGELEIISNKSCENAYRNNVFIRSRGTLTLRHGNRCLVTGNWFIGDGRQGAGGVRVIGEDHVVANNYFEGLTGRASGAALSTVTGMTDAALNEYGQVKRAVVARNLFANNRSTVELNVGYGTRERRFLVAVDSRIEENVFASGDTMVIAIDDVSGVTWADNLFDGPTGFDPGPSNKVGDAMLVRGSDGTLASGVRPKAGPGVPMLKRSETGPGWIERIEGADER